MRLPQFEYLAPRTLEEACSFLAKHREEAFAFAGGTDLFVKMKQRRIVPGYLVNLKHIRGMDFIEYDEDKGLRIGALVTIQSLKSSVVVKRRFKILADAAGVESSVQIRNVATLGGNIANASPAADAPLALIVLGASVVLMGVYGQREVLLEDFFLGPGKSVLQCGEIIKEIRIPPPWARTGGTYLKHAIRRTDIAIVSVAVVLRLAEDVCGDARIALGSVAPTAFRAKRAENWLKDKKVTDELAGEAARAAMEESRPIDDIRGYAEYRAKTVLDITKNAADFGYSPLPYWKEVADLPRLTPEFPLLMTNAKEDVYMLTGYKHVPSLRNMKPEPIIEMHPETGRGLGLKEGTWVYIETGKGRVMQRLAFDPDLDPRIVVVSFGWWFPEARSRIFAWDQSNINVLTRSEPPYDPGVGTVDLRGIPCRVYKA